LPGPATGAAAEATGRADAALLLAPTCAATGKASVAAVKTQKYKLLFFMHTRFLTKWLWPARR